MTSFKNVYNLAKNNMKNYNLLNLVSEDREEILKGYLINSLVDFKYINDTNINSYDLEQEQFLDDLTLEENVLLGIGITYYWVSQEVANSELLRDKIGRKDYTIFSPGNLLDKLITLRETLRQEYRSRVNEFSWRQGDLGNLKVVK